MGGLSAVKMESVSDQIRAIVLKQLSALLPEPVPISDQTNIVRDLGLDSLAVMDFVMAIEDDLDISVPLDRIAEVETVGDLIRTLDELKAQG